MRVICAGEMLVDIFVRPVQQIPFENDTQIVPDIRITSGGDANNNAINFAKLGHQVAYLGRLGCDEMGDYVASLAQAAGIDISHTVRSSTAVSYTHLPGIALNHFRDQGKSAGCHSDQLPPDTAQRASSL